MLDTDHTGGAIRHDSATLTTSEIAIAVLAAIAGSAVVLAPWIANAWHAIPDAALAGHDGWGADARLILYVLTWGARALGSAPLRLFDAPVGFPAPASLTGSEHFLGSQIIFGPAYWLSENPVLSANCAALLSYPAAMLVLYLWSRRLGLGVTPAAITGVVAGFAGLQAEADLHVLQYPIWCVALVGLAAEPCTQGTGWLRPALFGTALAVACATSYQTAAAALVVAAVMVLDSFRREGMRATRGLVVATLVVLGFLIVVSLPYVGRLGEHSPPIMTPDLELEFARLMRAWVMAQLDPMIAALALAAVVIVWWTHPTHRRTIALGSVLSLIGLVLAAGPGMRLGDNVLWLPWKWIGAIPGSHAVNHPRFVVLAMVGFALLVGVTFDALERSLRSRPIGRILLLSSLAAVVVGRCVGGVHSAPMGQLPFGANAPNPWQWLAAMDDGTVLDLLPPLGLENAERGSPVANSNAMLGNLVHGHPVTAIHTHYVPAGSMLVRGLGYRSPDEDITQALVDMADLRWVLVPSRTEELADAWLKVPGVTRAAWFRDGQILEVHRPHQRPWVAALKAGPREGYSLLGTPLDRRADPKPHAMLQMTRPRVQARQAVPATLTVSNGGTDAWPVALPPWIPSERGVAVEVVWFGQRAHRQRIALPWDLTPQDAIRMMVVVTAPDTPGRYVVSTSLTWNGDTFTGPDDRRIVQVDPPG